MVGEKENTNCVLTDLIDRAAQLLHELSGKKLFVG